MKILEVPIEKIIEPKNVLRIKPSEESIHKLANSISKLGLINPITTRLLPSGNYEIITGHRRYLACKMLNLKKITCNIIDKNDKITEAQKIAENMERKNLTDFEGIIAMAKYADDYKLSMNEFCDLFGITKATALKYITLAEAPDDIKICLHNGTINMSAAMELVLIKSLEDRINFTKQTIEYKWSAAQLKQNIEMWKATIEWKKYQEEHKEEINGKTVHMATYVTCQMCDTETPIEEIESLSVCKSCRDAIETIRLKQKIEKAEKAQ